MKNQNPALTHQFERIGNKLHLLRHTKKDLMSRTMKFNNAFCFVLLLLCNTVFAKKTILIKYSFNDCVACNINLYNIKNVKYPDAQLIVCFKKNGFSTSNVGYEEIMKYINDNNIQDVISDSLYYAYDNSERSMIYMLDNGTMKKSAYLKTVHFSEFFNDKESDIITPSLSSITCSDNAIYMGQINEPFLLKINKAGLNNVADTLWFFTDKIRKQIFEKRYGAFAAGKLDEIDEISKQMPVPKHSNLIDVVIDKNNNIKLLLGVYSIITVPKPGTTDTIVNIFSFPVILNFYNGALKSIDVLNINDSVGYAHNGYHEEYRLEGSMMMQHKDGLVMIIKPNQPHYLSPILANISMTAKGYAIKKILPYPIDSLFIENGMGTRMILKTYSEPYFIERSSKKIMNLDNEKIFRIPVTATNNFTKSQADNLTLSPNYEAISMNNDGKLLRVLVRNNEQLQLLNYNILSNGDLQYNNRKTLSDNYQSDKVYNASSTCDKEGIYTYHYQERKFSFVPY